MRIQILLLTIALFFLIKCESMTDIDLANYLKDNSNEYITKCSFKRFGVKSIEWENTYNHVKDVYINTDRLDTLDLDRDKYIFQIFDDTFYILKEDSNNFNLYLELTHHSDFKDTTIIVGQDSIPVNYLFSIKLKNSNQNNIEFSDIKHDSSFNLSIDRYLKPKQKLVERYDSFENIYIDSFEDITLGDVTFKNCLKIIMVYSEDLYSNLKLVFWFHQTKGLLQYQYIDKYMDSIGFLNKDKLFE